MSSYRQVTVELFAGSSPPSDPGEASKTPPSVVEDEPAPPVICKKGKCAPYDPTKDRVRNRLSKLKRSFFFPPFRRSCKARWSAPSARESPRRGKGYSRRSERGSSRRTRCCRSRQGEETLDQRCKDVEWRFQCLCTAVVFAAGFVATAAAAAARVPAVATVVASFACAVVDDAVAAAITTVAVAFANLTSL